MSTTSIHPRVSQSQTPIPIQRGPDGRHIRLTSIRNRRHGTPFRIETPIISRNGSDRPKPQCRNKECPQSKVEEQEGKLVCMNCGFVLQESQITQELTFGEASNGAAIVQGAYVGQDEGVARNPAMAGNRMGGGMTSREQTERNGSHFMNNLIQALRLQQIDKERGMKYFKLASSNNFIQGRITRYVASVCLYLACRGEQDCKVMLIDFSDILEVNVFKLGSIYNDLVETLHLTGQDIRGNIFECNPENLIQRFAQDLEFGADEHRIANEAVQILKRMRRDWIYTGRRPAGVCGAALILAARMNNYRRTVREVVYTAKVADVTINKRLDEFKFTDSSQLTVDEFRHHGVDLQKEHDPPAYYEQFQKKKTRKGSKRKAAEIEAEEDAISVLASARVSEEPESARTSLGPEVSLGPEALTREEQDSRAMPPPAIPIDPQLESITTNGSAKRVKVSHSPFEEAEDEEQNDNDDDDDEEGMEDDSTPSMGVATENRGRGRPKGARNKPLPIKTAIAIADEEQTEKDMLEALDDPKNQAEAERYHQSIFPTPPQTQQLFVSQEPQHGPLPGALDLDSIIIYDNEFEDDPEVRDCLLRPEDIAIKEAVWVTNNGTWLKEQQARKIKQELAEKSGTVKVPQKRKRHRKRLGDMSEYDIQNEDGTVSRPTTAAEATRMMLQKRGYSKKINYEAIVARAYDRSPSEASGTPSSESLSFIHSGSERRRRSSDYSAKITAGRLKAQIDKDTASASKAISPKVAVQDPSLASQSKATAEPDVYQTERSELTVLVKEAAPLIDEDDDDDDDAEEDEEEEETGTVRGDDDEDDNFTDYGDEI